MTRPDARVKKITPLWKPLNSAAKKILDNFDLALDSVFNLTPAQKAQLPKNISALSKLLTSERSDRRLSYMNDRESLSAYSYYFLWWGLVRLTSLSAIRDIDAPNDIALDIGSGPLTVPVALWLSNPKLRERPLQFYCVDISSGALKLGTLLLDYIMTQLPSNGGTRWRVIPVKGAYGVDIRQKASLITSANMFNEVIDFFGDEKTSLLKFATSDSTVAIIEPGDPQSGLFISKTRKKLLKKDFIPLSPCTHFMDCPFPAVAAHHGGKAKWCNFAFCVDDFEDKKGTTSVSEHLIKAPKRLLDLSKRSHLKKTRAALCYFIGKCTGEPLPTNTDSQEKESKVREADNDNIKTFRITSDLITLPWGEGGYYACGDGVLHLLIPVVEEGKDSVLHFYNGDRVVLSMSPRKTFGRDKKTGAVIIRVAK